MFVLNLFKGKLPVPVVIYSDNAKSLIDRVYFIYEKIEGVNLYEKWHEYTVSERKGIVEELCRFLRVIHAEPYEGFAERFHVDTTRSWKDIMLGKIEAAIAKIPDRAVLPEALIEKVRMFLSKHEGSLDESRLALTYYDLHFDNVLVKDTRVTGLLDLERADVMSIDYTLDLVKRMVDFPLKYASDKSKPFVKVKGYKDLMEYYREFYPELFAFNDLETRLKIYAIEYDLGTLFWWPEHEQLRTNIIANSTL